MNVTIFNNKYKGFLLIELVIAIGIFSMVALLSLSFYWHITRVNLENESKIKGINIASSCLELAFAQKNIKNRQEFTIDKNYNVIIVPISITNGSYKKKFIMAQIIVTWQINNQDKSVTLITGIVL